MDSRVENDWSGFVAKLDGDDGSRMWESRVDGPGPSWLDAVDADGEGGIYTGGWIDGDLPESKSIGNRDGLILKYSSGGERLWSARLGSVAEDSVKDLVFSAKSGLFVLGDTSGVLPGQSAKGGPRDPLKGPDDLFVVRLTDMGKVEWSLQLGSQGGDRASEIALAGDELLVVTGTSESFDDYEYIPNLQLAYASLMTLDGRSRVDYQLPLAGSNTSVRAVDVMPDSSIALAGSTCVREPLPL